MNLSDCAPRPAHVGGGSDTALGETRSPNDGSIPAVTGPPSPISRVGKAARAFFNVRVGSVALGGSWTARTGRSMVYYGSRPLST